jgi:hypothetical protein
MLLFYIKLGLFIAVGLFVFAVYRGLCGFFARCDESARKLFR